APWLDPYSFRPEAEPTANAPWWPFGLATWPLFAALDQVRAWNAFVLLTFLAAGALACAWLRELGLPRAAALVGGAALPLAPYRVVESRGHLLGPISVLLPLALLACERAIREQPAAAAADGTQPAPARPGRQGWWWLSRGALVSIPLSGQ